jgi:elongation factor Ts
MAAVTAALVKQLRDQTGAGMMDCKAALTETAGDFEAAVDWLRKKGLAAAAKKAGRIAAQGLIGLATAARRGALVEVNSETDFVARNQEFQALVRTIAELALEVGGDLDRLRSARVPGTGRTVAEEITQAIARIGENINLRRSAAVEVGEGVVGTYVHGALAPGLGTIGVLVGLQSAGDPERLMALGKQLAMHVAAARPHAVTVDRLDAATLARERAIYAEQARTSGKPDNIIDKIVEGRIRKFYEEAVLLEQAFVIDPELKVEDAIDRVAEELGSSIALTEFVRFALGEGIAPPGSDLEAAQLTAT